MHRMDTNTQPIITSGSKNKVIKYNNKLTELINPFKFLKEHYPYLINQVYFNIQPSNAKYYPIKGHGHYLRHILEVKREILKLLKILSLFPFFKEGYETLDILSFRRKEVLNVEEDIYPDSSNDYVIHPTKSQLLFKIPESFYADILSDDYILNEAVLRFKNKSNNYKNIYVRPPLKDISNYPLNSFGNKPNDDFITEFGFYTNCILTYYMSFNIDDYRTLLPSSILWATLPSFEDQFTKNIEFLKLLDKNIPVKIATKLKESLELEKTTDYRTAFFIVHYDYFILMIASKDILIQFDVISYQNFSCVMCDKNGMYYGLSCNANDNHKINLLCQHLNALLHYKSLSTVDPHKDFPEKYYHIG